MIDDEIRSIDKRSAQNIRCLLCDTTGNVGELTSPDEQWVSSPIRCLDKAVEETPGIIVVRFGKVSIPMREVLVELCVVLKHNSHTRKCRVFALLNSKHRKILEELNRAGVDFIGYGDDTPLDSDQMREIICGLGTNDQPESHLKVLCPFLHYSKIDSRDEMTKCGAYLDRMVLGGHWLHEICETENHLRCEYFLNPRVKS
jgi:hypothetical protein